jgi:hypothetical protein
MTLYQPPSTPLSVQYQPDEHTILIENPPRFTWMPARLDDECYRLQVASSPDFSDAQTYEPIRLNVFTPPQAFPVGRHYWRYALCDAPDQWSIVRTFTVPPDLSQTPLPPADQRYTHAEMAHPRLWLNPARLADFRAKLAQDPDWCGWSAFYQQSVLPWVDRPLIAEPAPYPNNQRTAALWRAMYIACQECFYAIRHLSVAARILQDDALLDKARMWLLHVAAWNTEGATSRDYNDEAAFRITGALAWGYDWLYDLLSDDQRAAVRRSLVRRTEQVAQHVIERSKIHHVPYDSHAVRSLSSVLAPCCIALLDDLPQARQWLDYTLEYYAGLYTPWGGVDGGWAEGGMYWTTGMAFLIDALNLLRNFSGLDFYQRPFFQKTGDFPLYVFSPDTRRASFGDQSNLGEPPILKTAYNMRQFAAVTGNGLYQWYYEQVHEPDADSKFYNYGWWDFRFDDLMYRCDYPAVIAVAPPAAPLVKHFRDVGWVAFHNRMDDPAEHVMLLFKSSRYGSISHSHGDQNAFVLHAYGEPLAITSGYYVAFGSTMHRQWRRQTRSTNGLLIDGEGQYAGQDKLLCIEAQGQIESVENRDGIQYARAAATAAYHHTVPALKQYTREVYFMDGAYFVIVDQVVLHEAKTVQWLLHALHPFTLHDQRFSVAGERASLEGRFVYCSSGALMLTQDDRFTEVDASEIEGLPAQYHLTATTPPALQHRIVTLLLPLRAGEQRYVSTFIDDQGHGVRVYFVHEGVTRSV